MVNNTSYITCMFFNMFYNYSVETTLIHIKHIAHILGHVKENKTKNRNETDQ